MNRVEFGKQLVEGRLLPAYLFLGEEKLFHEELTALALRQLLPGEERDFNYLRLNAASLKAEELSVNLETAPFFGAARLVSLQEFENAPAGLDEALLKTLSGMADGVYLLISAAKLDGRKKNHQELQKRLPVVDCNRLNPADLPVWVKQRGEKMGLKLTPWQTKLLSQRCGPDLLRLRTELEKLAVFAGADPTVTDAVIDELVPGEPEPDIFGLIDAVAARNPRAGLPRLKELLDAGENELKILATLARQFRNISAALEAKGKGLTAKSLAGLLGINPYVAEKSFTQAGRFALRELHSVMERLLRADYRIKTGQREARLELEMAVAEICMMKKDSVH